MADAKISQLTSATTPLAGTEVLPIVQSSTTKKVAVSDLTEGRTVRMAAGVAAAAGAADVGFAYNITSFSGARIGFNNSGSTNAYGAPTGYAYTGVAQAFPFTITTSATQRLTVEAAGNVTVNTGNIVQGTAAKGIDFSANTPAAGKTSTLLNWYEEGTWTPNQGAGLTLVGAFSSTGTYTRIGRQVFVRGSVSGATSVAVASAGAISTNLPYSSAADTTGAAINATNDASSVLRISSATLTAATAIAATATITFSAVYSV